MYQSMLIDARNQLLIAGNRPSSLESRRLISPEHHKSGSNLCGWPSTKWWKVEYLAGTHQPDWLLFRLTDFQLGLGDLPTQLVGECHFAIWTHHGMRGPSPFQNWFLHVEQGRSVYGYDMDL